jgi:putative phosphoribosyl transferase
MNEEEEIIFINRDDAGSRLAKKLLDLHIVADIVLAIPRGGVPVGLVIAQALKLPLKLYLVRKIGHPSNNEYAIGAVSENDLLMNPIESPEQIYLEKTIQKERLRISEMKLKFGQTALPKDLLGKNVIIADDGIATGTCMELAVREARKSGAKTIIVAAPVCPGSTAEKISAQNDLTVILQKPQYFTGIGAYYHDFSQLTDQEVIEILKKSPKTAT